MINASTSPFVCALLGFFASRIAYHWIGIRFDSTPLIWFWQIIDPYLLENHLTSSLLHLHTQPPLFNAFVGTILKISGYWFSPVMNVLYLLFGVCFLWAVYTALVQFGTGRNLASIFATLFLISPASILYENWLFYTYPMALLLIFSLVLLHRSIAQQSGFFTLLFFLTLSFCVLIRTAFHLIWFLAILFFVLRFQRERTKKILMAAALPFALVLFVYAQNVYLFGQYPGSTWLGMSLFKIVSSEIPLEQRAELVRQGKISPFALRGAYSPLSAYPPELHLGHDTGVPLLDQKIKTTGFNNYNHFAYLQISRHNLQDSLYLIFWAPRSYLGSVAESFRIYTFSAGQLVFLRQNREKIGPAHSWLDRFVLGDFSGQPDGPYWFMIFGLPLLFVYGIVKTRFFFREGNSAAAITLLFLVLNILYASVVGNLLEIGENNRYRYEIDSYFVILLALAVSDIFRTFFGAKVSFRRGSDFAEDS